MKNWWQQWSYAVIPATCILCESPAHRGLDLCDACEDELPRIRHRCAICSLPLPLPATICGRCMLSPPAYQTSFAAFEYRRPVDQLIRQFKDAHQIVTGRVLARVMANAYIETIPRQRWPHRLIPVPLHPRRQQERGFNQSLEIAQVLAALLGGIPIDTRSLRRPIDTPLQKTLSARARQRNLRDVFRLDPRSPLATVSTGTKGVSNDATGSQPVRIAIVDDVVTTGATVSAVAELLRHHGVGHIEVISLARTPMRSWPRPVS